MEFDRMKCVEANLPAPAAICRLTDAAAIIGRLGKANIIFLIVR
jgi:hypothetical protein